MNILVYGDSNSAGLMPNEDNYKKSTKLNYYPKNKLWWFGLAENNNVVCDALVGRAINEENPWLANRNATITFVSDFTKDKAQLKIEDFDIIILMLGSNDCKTIYNKTAEQISSSLENLIKIIRANSKAKIILIAPPQLKSGTKIVDKHYINGPQKTQKLTKLYAKLAKNNDFEIISALNCDIGIDGEHLTETGHTQLKTLVSNLIKQNNYNNLIRNK